jgi:beta-glucosidase
MALESGHRRLIEAVCAVQPNTVVVVMNGDAVEMPWADGANAILDMWYAGEGAGQAMADLLVGDANPAGKLAVTIPKRLSDCPAYLDFPHEQDVGVYREGIFVGYRWYDARRIEPLFPFGHGLSYTRFRYDSLCAEVRDGGYAVSVTLTNVGDWEGSEVVQLYVKPPKGPLFRPEKELKAFAKVALEPGEQKTVVLVLELRDFACYDDHLNAWRVMGGEYILQAGSSSRSLPLETLVWPRPTVEPVQKLKSDSHYTDIFRDRRSAGAYFDFLVEHGFLTRDQVTAKLEAELSKAFWGFSQHLDMLAGDRLSQAMLSELLERMNRALSEG